MSVGDERADKRKRPDAGEQQAAAANKLVHDDRIVDKKKLKFVGLTLGRGNLRHNKRRPNLHRRFYLLKIGHY